MWDDYGIFVIIGFALIAALLTFRVWSEWIYIFSKNWRIAAFIGVCGLIGAFVAIKQEHFKYELAYYYFTGTQNTGSAEARYQIRQCKDFIQAKIDGTPVKNDYSLTAGLFKVGHISNWEFCARTFGLNYWKHDISINGQNGGRLLCKAYARDTYRSGKMQTWCDTVFASTTDQKI